MKSKTHQAASKYSTSTSTHTSASRLRVDDSTETYGNRYKLRDAGRSSAKSSNRSIRSDRDDDGAATHADPKPTLTEVKIDKLIVALYSDVLSDEDATNISARLRKLVRKSKSVEGWKVYARGSAKGEIFKRVVIQRLPSGAVVKYACEPTRPQVRQRIQITLNPGHIEDSDSVALRRALALVLGVEWQHLIRKALCTRIDACIDGIHVDIDRLLIMFSGARSHGTFYVHVDRSGRIGTVYLGSAQSATHGVAYDQVASDEHKQLVGEKTLVRQRVADDAEVVLKAKEARTRFEVRNVLKTPLPLKALEQMTTSLDKFRIYQLSQRAESKLGAHDLALLDMLRLRGECGAKARLERQRNGRAAWERLESLLARHAAPWWNPESLANRLRDALNAAPVWAILAGRRS